MTTYADANDFFVYWGLTIDDQYEAQINRFLTMSATNIQAALQSAGAINCSLASWATDYLKNLNVILAAVLYHSDCSPKLDIEEKRLYMEFCNGILDQIRDGRLEVCNNETGKDFPSITWAEQSTDEFSSAQIIFRDT